MKYLDLGNEMVQAVSHCLYLPSVFMVEVPTKTCRMEKLEWKVKLNVC